MYFCLKQSITSKFRSYGLASGWQTLKREYKNVNYTLFLTLFISYEEKTGIMFVHVFHLTDLTNLVTRRK